MFERNENPAEATRLESRQPPLSPPPPRRRPPGFRLSAADVAVLALTAAATWALWPYAGDLAALLSVVVGHFFLFCNVFRVRRAYELIWAVAFVANVCAWVVVAERVSWVGIVLCQMPVTVAAIAAEVMSDRYHGVGHGWLKRRRTAGAAGGAS